MADDPAQIEAIQAQKAADARQASSQQAVRRVLAELDYQAGDTHLDYPALLHRLEEVIARELTTLGG